MWPSYHRREETVPLFISSLTGTELCLVQYGFLSLLFRLCVCVCVLSSHSLWHSSFQCGHRNQSVLRWPHSPPRWRRGLRCAAGRTPLWKERRRKRWSSGVCLMGMQLPEITQNKSNRNSARYCLTPRPPGGKNICCTVLCCTEYLFRGIVHQLMTDKINLLWFWNLIVSVHFQSCWVQLLCEDLLLFVALYDQINVFGFWSVVWTNQFKHIVFVTGTL